MSKIPRVGLYLGPGIIVRNPGYLEALRERIGLNWVIISYTGELPPEVLTLSPYDGAPPSPARVRSLIARHLDGQPSTTEFKSAMQSVGPHFSASHNEAELRQAIAMAHGAGLDVWLLAGMYTASDFDVLMYCPSREENNRWYEAAYTHLATAYDVEGLDITHARYPMTSYPRGLFLCMCDACAQSAAELGYDMGAMQADIRDAYGRLQQLDPVQVASLAQHDMGPFDLLQYLGMRTGVVEWFKFRMALLARNVSRFRNAIHQAAGDNFIFGVDTYPASIATLAGHNLSRWAEFSDFSSPLLSHVDIFPMKTMVVWAEFLRSLLPQISEADALQIVYRVTGYASLDLPDTIAAFALGEPDCEYRNIPLRDFVALDMAKGKLMLPAGLPAYPIIQGGGAPWEWPRQIVQGLMDDAMRLGYDGYIFQGTTVLLDFELK
jgi:hypothetical protein